MIIGCETPRLFTQPRRALTPETSLGFEVIDFARDRCGIDLLPWQTWLVKAMLELNEDSSFRYRRIVVLVGRQSGKTTLLKVLALWVMQRTPGRMVLGVAQDLGIARESWQGAVDLTERDHLAPLLAAKNPVRYSTGNLELTFANRSRYKIAAANGRAGRGLSVNLLVLDELREMKDWSPYQALAPTITAQADGLIVAISNAGEHDSVVLNGLRNTALAGEEDAVGLFEWSAPDGCALDDPDAWAQANPGLGHTVQESDLRVAYKTFPAAQFRIEHLCQRVDILDSAIDLAAWKSCADPQGTLDGLRDRVAVALEVSPDLQHVTLYAAALADDGRVHVDVVKDWADAKTARAELPALLDRVKPRVFGWLPGGPAAALAAELRDVKGAHELKASELGALCMGFAEQVIARQIVHTNDPLLNAHIAQASKVNAGDGWKFSRRDGRHVDALYAAAGAVHLARTLKPSVGKQRIIIAA